ncbi:group II intron reverse transcriptase/maturase [uncultured Methanobrevibacter sp.]|uniref:group II intron reverse transcriptase/maturase n=1 Tax=uncultured Methanobrevibacter sp. TaxID=253161 RepID=UPI00261B98F5|nr:group II intron reverse transcriptase/maturase [uncultured Methanobrevibacter sp.]
MRLTPNNNICEPAKPDTVDWKNIKWYRVNRHVDSLQKRIYRASKNNDKKKVRDLQRQLMRSNSCLLKAINRVTKENKGRFTPGIDGFKATSDRARGELFDMMKNEKMKLHKPKPAFRKYIPKKNGKLRSLGIPTIKDRIYQEIIRMALEPEWEAKFEPTSYGFRPKRSTHDAARRIHFNIRGNKWCWVYEGDFQACFDTLNHEFILKQIKGFPQYNLVKRFLEAGYVDNNVFHNTVEGTPQGGLLSPLLANIALHGMEEALGISYRPFNTKDGVMYKTKGNYRVVRYADDFLIFARSKEEIMKVESILEQYFEERGLILSKEKTFIKHISEGFDFVGFNFRQYKTKDGLKCFSKPSKDSIKKFKMKVDEIVKDCYGSNVEVLINWLNPVIRGTTNYWRHVVSKEVFYAMDAYIFKKVYRFLCRMHSNKGKRWINKRYFPYFSDGKHSSKWVLTDPRTGIHLIRMGWTPIRRHIMIKHNYSPYDRDKTEYFKLRGSKPVL